MRGRGVASVVRALSSVWGGALSLFFFFRSHPFCLSSPAPAPLLCTPEQIPALVVDVTTKFAVLRVPRVAVAAEEAVGESLGAQRQRWLTGPAQRGPSRLFPAGAPEEWVDFWSAQDARRLKSHSDRGTRGTLLARLLRRAEPGLRARSWAGQESRTASGWKKGHSS